MSKLLTALIAAGFGFGLNAAVAQDVKSDSEKAKGQEEIMQQKEQGVDQSAKGQRERPAAANEGRTTQGAGSADDNASAAQDQNAPQTQDGKKIPGQSAPGVGHPNEGKTTGQGEGVKKDNQQSGQPDNSGTGMSNQDNSSGQAGTDQSADKKKKRMQQ
jgi:hypothetical protein